jgi:hypothetical protein
MMGNEGVDANTADVMKLIGRFDIQGKTCEVKAATPKANCGMRNGRRGDDSNMRVMQQQPTYGAGAPVPAFFGEHVGALGPANSAVLDSMMYHGYPAPAVSPAAMYYPPPPYMALPGGGYAPYPYISMEYIPPAGAPDAPIPAVMLAPPAVASPQFLPHVPAMVASSPPGGGAMFPPPFGIPPVVYGGGMVHAGGMMPLPMPPMDDTTDGVSEQGTAPL